MNYRFLFIAMSGVRVKNEALLEVGLTLPGFVERSQVVASLPSLSLLTLAALTPGYWDVEYVEIDDLTAENLENIAVAGWDLVAISSLSARVLDAYRLPDYSYWEMLTFVCLTSPPALLYAIPVDQFLSLEVARNINLIFLAVVAAWRVALLIFYLRRGLGISALLRLISPALQSLRPLSGVNQLVSW